LLHEFFALPLSLGSVVDMQQTASAALKGVYEILHSAVQQQERCNIDETGWKQAGKRRWLWTMVTTIASVFVVSTSRSGPALRQLLGECYAGIMTSDRHRPHLKQRSERHQVCWSHLIRI
jgi:transposase